MNQEEDEGTDEDEVDVLVDERSSPTNVPLAVEDEASELEDSLFAESIIRSRSHYYRTTTTSNDNTSSSIPLPTLARSTSVQSYGSGPGAYAIPGMSSVPPPPSAGLHRAVTMAPAGDANVAEPTDRVPPGGSAEPVSPTPRLPKYALRDGPSSSPIYSMAPPTLTFSVTTMTGRSMVPVAEEEEDEAPELMEEEGAVAEDVPAGVASSGASVHATPPSSSEMSPETAPLSNFPPIEAFSAPVESELVHVAVPFDIDEDEDEHKGVGSWLRNPLAWVLLGTAVAVLVATTVAVVCANGSCTTSTPPVNERAVALYDYINEITLATEKQPISYVNSSNPEEKALHWLIAEDPLQLSAPADAVHIRQRYALLTLWYSNVESNPWRNTTGWLKDDDECRWAGVTCDDNRVVTGLELLGTGVEGGLPPDVALLTELQQLNMNCEKNIAYFFSCLSGTVPPSLATLSRLRRLAFDSNNLTGPVAPWLGNWSHLEYIDISLNNLTGTLPADVMSTWTQLTSIEFSINRFSGSLPEAAMVHWRNVNSLAFSWNLLSGTLPEVLSAWTNVTYFDIGGNQLVGTIPKGIEENWTNLYSVTLFPNQFTGSIPMLLCRDRVDGTTEVCSLNGTSPV